MVSIPRSLKMFAVVAGMLVATLVPFVPAHASVYSRSGSCWNIAGKHNATVTWDVANGVSIAKSVSASNSVPFSRSDITVEIYANQSQLVWTQTRTASSTTFTPNHGGYTSGGVWVRVWFANNAPGGASSWCNIDILD
jgi:hypothetical protein